MSMQFLPPPPPPNHKMLEPSLLYCVEPYAVFAVKVITVQLPYSSKFSRLNNFVILDKRITVHACNFVLSNNYSFKCLQICIMVYTHLAKSMLSYSATTCHHVMVMH